jgi:hypothetical protein
MRSHFFATRILEDPMSTSCSARRLDQRKTTGTTNEAEYKLPTSKIVPRYTRDHQQNKFPSVSSKVTCRRRIYRTQVIPWLRQRPSRFLITCLAKMAFDKEYWATNHARALSTSCATLSPFACRSSIVNFALIFARLASFSPRVRPMSCCSRKLIVP